MGEKTQDTETYLNVLIDSLKKKSRVLDEISIMNDEQARIFKAREFDENAFDQNMKKKDKLISDLDILNSGFEEVYSYVRDELLKNSEAHKEHIKMLQELIKSIVDKSLNIQAQEKTNKESAQLQFSRMRKRVRESRMSSNVAAHYYRTMSNLHNVESQFLDKSK